MSELAERPAGRLRSTRQVTDLQQVMREVDGFRTAGEIFDETRRRGMKIAIATIYRNLKIFADSGLVDALHREDGELQYRLCGSALDDAAGHHHHHLVCRVCGASVEVAGPEVEAWASKVARAAGYTDISHTVEIFGLCPRHPAPHHRPPQTP